MWRDVETERLAVQLHNCNAAEEVGAEQGSNWPPGSKNHQRQGDPAAPGRHVLGPERCLHNRQIGPSQPGAGAAKEQRCIANCHNRVADGVRCVVVLTNCANDQSGSRLCQSPADPDDQHQRNVDQYVMRK